MERRRILYIRNSHDHEIELESGDEIELIITALESPVTLTLKIKKKEADLRGDLKEINPEDHVYKPS